MYCDCKSAMRFCLMASSCGSIPLCKWRSGGGEVHDSAADASVRAKGALLRASGREHLRRCALQHVHVHTAGNLAPQARCPAGKEGLQHYCKEKRLGAARMPAKDRVSYYYDSACCAVLRLAGWSHTIVA